MRLLRAPRRSPRGLEVAAKTRPEWTKIRVGKITPPDLKIENFKNSQNMLDMFDMLENFDIMNFYFFLMIFQTFNICINISRISDVLDFEIRW